jgi:hypothetical protein
VADASGEIYNLLFHDATELAGWRDAIIGRHAAVGGEGEDEEDEEEDDEAHEGEEEDVYSDENGA